MNKKNLRNTLAASAVLAMGAGLYAAEPNMGNNHFEGVSLQAGINFETHRQKRIYPGFKT